MKYNDEILEQAKKSKERGRTSHACRGKRHRSDKRRS